MSKYINMVCWYLCVVAVNLVVESLDDVAVLQDGPMFMDPDLFQSVLDDLQLRALLEVFFFKVMLFLN